MTFPSPDAPGRFGLTPAKAVVVAMALVVLVVVAVLVVVFVFVLGPGRSGEQQGVAPSALPSQAASTTAADRPCPDNEGSQDREVTQAPAATWRYQDLTAFPVSPEYGPAVTDNIGRFCFQHSPTGALFMAATAAAAGSAISGDYGEAYQARVLAQGPNREKLLSKGTPGYGGQDTRIAIKGFKVLDYTGQTATIDLGLDGTVKGQQAFASAVYLLVWQDGDWKLRTDVEQAVNVSIVPDLAGYIPWGP